MSMDFWRVGKAACAALISLWLGLHVMIQLLVYAIAFDIATGLVAGWIDRQISSDFGRRGVAKKTLILLAVAAAEIAGRHAGMEITVPWGGTWGLGAAVAGYYAIQEAISITENLARAGVPLPQFVVDRLRQLRSLEKSQ